MKTLKNFPMLVADPTTNEQKIVEWKEDFEKEIPRKFKESLREIRKHVEHGYVSWDVVRDTICDLRDKEILGLTEKQILGVSEKEKVKT